MRPHIFSRREQIASFGLDHLLTPLIIVKKLDTMIDWQSVYESLDEKGYARIPAHVSKPQCEALCALYTDASCFRSTINMERYRFGKGEYKYFQYPLPDVAQTIRRDWFPPLATLANAWMEKLNQSIRYPSTHQAFLKQCADAGQQRPTPLMLRYGQGGFNTLHQDLYGDLFFPFQVVLALRQKGVDYTGGELVFTAQLPRAQSRAEVVQPDQGDAIIFTTNFRPVKGARGYYQSRMKHGVSEITSGERFSMGVIFHDAT